MDDDTIRAIAKEYRLLNADIYLGCDATEDDLIDVIEGNRKYVPCIYVLNKIDSITMEELEVLDKIPHYVPIAGMLGWNFDELLESIWDYQDLIRVYTKPKVKLLDLRGKFQIMTLRSS
jgi:ribosome-interacting GTPase 1